ncbi:extracellular electron transfer flavoprotein PplA [Oenococcus oeni]|uniref:extracellular electron transfer flavoprotein PplA n=1 Tax=Oenococcus oeni TaxID=1247 RepID=UPI002954AA99|nr:extracellular electron transfer flavoprotein PplA [Oenococcus oeni]
MKTSKTLKSIALTSAAFMSLGSFAVATPAVFPNTSVTASAAKTAKQTAGKKLKNGTYKLAEQDYYNGYRVVMSMKVKNNKIVSNKYDYVNKKGKSKTDDAAYEKAMKKANRVGPKEYIPTLLKSWKKAGTDVQTIDTVSGATDSSWTIKNYAQQLIQAAQAGNHKTIKIDNTAKLQNGTYKLAEKNYDHGYRIVFSITVANGKLTKSNFDYVNKKGKSKTDDAAYEKAMKKANGVGPKEYIPKLNEELIKSYGSKEPSAVVDTVSGATESSNLFVIYAQQLINRAQAGNHKTVKISNIIYSD